MHVHCPDPCCRPNPCCKSMSILHVHVHVGCLCQCCMSMSMSIYIYMYRNVGMPDCPASGQTGTNGKRQLPLVCCKRKTENENMFSLVGKLSNLCSFTYLLPWLLFTAMCIKIFTKVYNATFPLFR
jgi:hypothetical protein